MKIPHHPLLLCLLSLYISHYALGTITVLTDSDFTNYTAPTLLNLSEGSILNTQAENEESLLNITNSSALDNQFIIALQTADGISIGSTTDNIAQTNTGYITNTNTSTINSGAIALWNNGATLGALQGSLSASSSSDSRALYMNKGSISSITGTISASSNASSEGALITGGDIGSIQDASITSSTTGSFSSAVGLEFTAAEGNTVKVGDIDATISVTTSGGQASVITSSVPSNLGTISGNYSIDATASVSFAVYSVGYLLGNKARSTTTSIAFKNTGKDTSGTAFNDSSSFDINWDSIHLSVSRIDQFAAGVALFKQTSTAPNDADFYLGSGSSIAASVKGSGTSVAIWLNGSEAGDISGSVSASTVDGESYGIATVGREGLSSLIAQSTGNSELGDIAGTITSKTTGTGTAYGLLIGDRVTVNGVSTNFTTTLGTISGRITASSQSTNATAAIGIQDISSNALVFAGGAQITASVSGGHGTAILNTTEGIRVTAQDSSASNSVTISGNLDAGSEALAFLSGHFDIASSQWDATAGVTLGSDSSTDVTTLYNTAIVTSSDLLTVSASALDFYLNSSSNVSQLSVADNQTLALNDLSTVSIHLQGSLSAYEGNVPIYLVDAREAESFTWSNESGITYVLYLNGAEIDPSSTLFVRHDSTGIYLLPEPSAVSMNLLAIAGLLLRRRRQHH